MNAIERKARELCEAAGGNPNRFEWEWEPCVECMMTAESSLWATGIIGRTKHGAY